MKKILILLLFLSPVLIYAQQVKNGSIIFDLHPKKQQIDTTQQTEQNPYQSDDDYAKQNTKKRTKANTEQQTTSVHEYWQQHGLFQAVFHAGINACQMDGDGYSGYNYLGAEFGVGARIKVHQVLSMSMEFNYSMRGAKETFRADSTLQYSTTYTSSRQMYQVQIDYIQVPIALNIDAVTVKNKQLMFLTFGITPGVAVRFKQFDEDGDNVTGNPPEGQPHRFDLSGFAGLYFIIHKNFALGGQFSYSMTRVRGPYIGGLGLSRLLGEYHNNLTFDFKYILDSPKKGKRINSR
jgi:hypothetical protein